VYDQLSYRERRILLHLNDHYPCSASVGVGGPRLHVDRKGPCGAAGRRGEDVDSSAVVASWVRLSEATGGRHPQEADDGTVCTRTHVSSASWMEFSRELHDECERLFLASYQAQGRDSCAPARTLEQPDVAAGQLCAPVSTVTAVLVLVLGAFTHGAASGRSTPWRAPPEGSAN